MTEEQIGALAQQLMADGVAFGGLSWSDSWGIVAEVRRLSLALRILAGLPDDAGHTHAATLGDRGSLYARGVLAGADPADVEGAIWAGSEPR